MTVLVGGMRVLNANFGQPRHIGNCLKADPAYDKGVADALGIPLSEVPKT